MRELSLFSGVGGGLLGTKLLGWKALGYVEINEYCQKVLRARIDDGILDDAPIFGDIRTFIDEGYAKAYQGMVDVVSGGFPCQPFSQAGKRAGEDDSRNMWPATLEVIRTVRPRFAFLENVTGLLSVDDGRYFGRILGDLAESGYDVRWRVLSAAEMGASHKRDRIWFLGYDSSIGIQGLWTDKESKSNSHAGEAIPLRSSGGACSLANDTIEGVRGLSIRQGRQNKQEVDFDGRGAWCDAVYVEGVGGKHWAVKPGLRLLVDGYAGRVDEIKGLGNAQVPAVAAEAWRLLSDGLD